MTFIAGPGLVEGVRLTEGPLYRGFTVLQVNNIQFFRLRLSLKEKKKVFHTTHLSFEITFRLNKALLRLN